MTAAAWFVVAHIGLVLALVGVLAMGPSARALKATPYGIVPFELAGTVKRSETILAAWGPAGQVQARRNLLADLVFLVGYSVLLAGLSVALGLWAADATWLVVARIGLGCAVAAVVAGLCDLLEDILLLLALHRAGHQRPVSSSGVAWAARLATLKFALIAGVVVWILLFAIPALPGSG